MGHTIDLNDTIGDFSIVNRIMKFRRFLEKNSLFLFEVYGRKYFYKHEKINIKYHVLEFYMPFANGITISYLLMSGFLK